MILCVTNRKGGTGKTSTAGNIAYQLAKTYGVLLIDADSQGSLTEWLVTDPPETELADVLSDRADPLSTPHRIGERLFILPTFSDGGLRDYAQNRAPSEPFAFADLAAKWAERFDFVVADLPPGMSSFEQSVLSACDRALPVIEPEMLAVNGLRDLMADLDRIKQKRRSAVDLHWIIANRINMGFRRHRMYLEALRENWQGYEFFEVPQSAAVSEAQTVHLPLELYNNKEQRALPQYRLLADALAEAAKYATV